MRRSPQPGAGAHANERRGRIEQGRRDFMNFRSKRRPESLGQNQFGYIVDEENFMGRSWEAGTPVRLIRESSETTADGLPIAGARAFGTVVSMVNHANDGDRRSRRRKLMVVVKLVSGEETTTVGTNLEKVTMLDLLAATQGEG